LGVCAAILVVAAVTALIYPLQKLDPGVSSGVLYVLGVLLVSVYWGLRLGLATAIASTVALDYFHTAPVGSFVSRDAGDVVALTTLFVTSAVAAVIADRARQRAEGAEERLRLQEMRASRARVLAAGDAERQRLVRNIHDGAQQRMVHTVVTLKLAGRALEADSAAQPLVDEALEHAERATGELRELAHGLLPAVLTRGGIGASVRELASRMAITVEVNVAVGRLATAIEATVYFVVAEALANVAKHSDAKRAVVTVALLDRVLRVCVSDDGVGGARQGGGNGLLGLEDRLAVLGGELRIESAADGGTRVEAEIPLLAGRPR
jgi:signal transduction histidine kinase